MQTSIAIVPFRNSNPLTWSALIGRIHFELVDVIPRGSADPNIPSYTPTKIYMTWIFIF